MFEALGSKTIPSKATATAKVIKGGNNKCSHVHNLCIVKQNAHTNMHVPVHKQLGLPSEDEKSWTMQNRELLPESLI